MNKTNKSVLVIDTPSGCTNCPLFFYNEMGSSHECKGTSGYNRQITIYGYQIKPDWCPLSPIPEKQVHNAIDNEFQRGAKSGYNYCIDEILKGAK